MDRRSNDRENVIVETAAGKLVGVRHGAIVSFKGIPFGNSPAGAMRWRPATARAPWIGVRDATRFAAVCPQTVSQLEALTGGMVGEQSEDCLYLNVWTPGCDSEKRPVMVWIHGGAFAIGAGSQSTYDGRHLAARDVVVVTINYRLGAFGFLDLADVSGGEMPGSGTEGLADQILALQWVRQNISTFGGDPENVCLFGESAGGMSVCALLASPGARGLFHKAIAQSGAAHAGYERERASRVAHALLKTLEVAPADAGKLTDISAQQIVKAQGTVLGSARIGRDQHKVGVMPFQPTLDGARLPVRPIEAVRAGCAHGIPVLTGTTREEWKLFTAADPRRRLMTAAGLEDRIRRLAGDATGDMLAIYQDGSPFDRFNAIVTDKNFTVPMIRFVEAQSAHTPVFVYRFDWRSPLLGGIMGSCHALELGFVFGTHGERLASAFFGSGRAAEALATAMMDCWAAFARSGDPSTAATGAWPPYAPSGEAAIFGDGAPHTATLALDDRLKVWDRIAERRLGP